MKGDVADGPVVPPPKVNKVKSGAVPKIDPVEKVIPLYATPAKDPDKATIAPLNDALTGTTVELTLAVLIS